MDKPLKDWTLGEVQDLCNSRHCTGCPIMQDNLCAVANSPNCWDLTDKPGYTADEIALAKLLVKAGVDAVQSDGGKDPLLNWGNSRSRLPAAAFPSLQPYKVVAMKDIAESEAQDG